MNAKVMNKNFYRGRKQDEEIEEFDKQMAATVENAEEHTKEESAPKVDENDKHDWKKRHADLRSYSQKEQNRLNREIEELKQALRNATTEGTRQYPKTEEEVQAWMEEYPEVAAIIETISAKQAEEKTSAVEVKIRELEEKRRQMDWDLAFKKLLNLHPDFEQIRDSSEFSEFDDENRLVGGWLYEQSPRIQKLILDPELDDGGVRDAASVIRMYKMDKGLDTSKTPKKSTQDNTAAALKVSKSGATTPSTDDGTPSFTESQIQRMTEREFEENFDLIQEAQRKGRVVNDISGPRR